ncbi:hypothetical protein [Oxobacter pfennigii]|uniref:hypothetical protein n=1 Tax=Oxobacter pfennigii TaxID=36849 RepID=UPI001364B877|nr:hypothetical protein [Oxobacter pfennigii]
MEQGRDNYEDYVLSGYGTLDRLGEEMPQEIVPVLNVLFGDEFKGRCSGSFVDEHKEMQNIPPRIR